MTQSIFPINIHIKETENLNRVNRPVRLGVPFPVGVINDADELQLKNNKKEPIAFQSKITSFWHDGSIRWLLIDFFVDIKSNENITFFLIKDSFQNAPQFIKPICIRDNENTVSIDTGVAEFKIDKKTFNPFNTILVNNNKLDIDCSSVSLIDTENTAYKVVIKKVSFSEDKVSLRITLNINGYFQKENHQNSSNILKFQSSLTFFSNSTLCELKFTLHNPNRALHPGGFWDLGDPGSSYFKSLSLSLTLPNVQEAHWKNIQEKLWNPLNISNSRLYQDSSGGDKWNHHIHIDKDNQSTVSFKGYQLKAENTISNKGHRASPIFSISNHKNTHIKVHIKQFWQNFPKALSIQDQQLNIEIFPQTEKSAYELQGGEQKTHCIILNFDNNNNLEQYVTPLKITLPLSHYSKCEAMPSLPENYNPTALDKFINQGIDGDDNFFIKREESDEYGWRNFGELWADHETLEHDNDRSLISHYNNQYDPIYGFARQYILTGESRWYELMCDLAKHVIDIDIYHTNQDRPEYNNGLFWHTDHYLDGRHCTHRTFSKTHMDIDHVEQSGGGPGSEHCYTQGLKYYYWLTGNITAKNTILSLSKWAEYSNDGNNTIVERLFNFVKTDLKNITRIKNGNYLFNYKYPLSRGTGNYLNALLDAYDLECDIETLKRIHGIIKQTIGPQDDIKYRHFMTDIETYWHYTIFLQSVLAFIKIKESEHCLDEDYQYALQSYCHYSQWIFKNEKPYLENTDLLVYPNDTWIAQDFRKLYLLKGYLKYCGKENTQEIKMKISMFENYIYQYFKNKKNKSTRILALIMQNQVNNIEESIHEPFRVNDSQLGIFNNKLTVSKTLMHLIFDLGHRLLSINLKNEYQWIQTRLKK